MANDTIRARIDGAAVAIREAWGQITTIELDII
jgi:hypothetical protein